MKLFVLIFTISLIIYNVETFEYQEDYNTEDERRSFDDYRELGQDAINYGPVLTPISTSNDNSNYVPNEANVKYSQNVVPEIPEIATEGAKQDSKKSYYEEKDAPELFQKFIKDFNKQYKDDEEYKKRYQNFVNNLKVINKLNKEQDATFDINMFADLGEGESVGG